MNENKISVIVPVYNIENYIEKTVESIRNQTYKNLEIILVDDGSSDNSGRVIDEIAAKDSRIQLIHQENGGVTSARIAGIKTNGITPYIGAASQIILIVLMFLGRVGGLTVIYAALSSPNKKLSKLPQEKIIVG